MTLGEYQDSMGSGMDPLAPQSPAAARSTVYVSGKPYPLKFDLQGQPYVEIDGPCVTADLTPEVIEALAERVARKVRTAPRSDREGIESMLLEWSGDDEHRRLLAEAISLLMSYHEVMLRVESDRSRFRRLIAAAVSVVGDNLMAAWDAAHENDAESA